MAIDKQTAESADDTERRGDGTWTNNNGYPYVGYIYDIRDVSARFTGISGLGGATIDVAYVSIYVNDLWGTALLKISAEDAESPTQISSAADFAGRTLTTEKVDWDSPAAGAWRDSPSIVSIIQELADSYDPTAIQIFIKDDGSPTGSENGIRMLTYDAGSTWGMKLHIEYTEGESCTTIVVNETNIVVDTSTVTVVGMEG